jgi:hypothetical protein
MREKFYKDIIILQRCKVCGVEYQTRKRALRNSLGFCYPCRKRYTRWLSKKNWANLSPEQKELKMGLLAEYRREWGMKYPEKHARHALESYHQHKDDLGKRARSHHKKKTAI